jgi:glyoxylase-like metal-dependent hydrolase (beta-lactamase superfamily II)
VGDTETVLIDAGNTPRLARELLAELEKIKAPPIRQIIYTHHHWDHVFGACVYGVPAIAHNLCNEKLAEEAGKPWSEAFLQQEVLRDPTLKTTMNVLREGVDNWGTFKIVVPTKTFEKSDILEGEGYKLELTHVDSKHSPDSVIVNVVGENVMFVADSFYPAPLRFNPTDRTLDVKVLEFMLASSCEIFVHGHGEPLTRENVKEILESVRI